MPACEEAYTANTVAIGFLCFRGRYRSYNDAFTQCHVVQKHPIPVARRV